MRLASLGSSPQQIRDLYSKLLQIVCEGIFGKPSALIWILLPLLLLHCCKCEIHDHTRTAHSHSEKDWDWKALRFRIIRSVWSLKELVANKVQFSSGSPVCTIDRSPNFFVSAPPILMRACTPHNNLYQSAKVCLDFSNRISNLDDNTLANNCKVFSNWENSPAKRPNCNQVSSVFLIRPVRSFCSISPFVIKPFDGDSPQSYARSARCPWAFMPRIKFFGQNRRTGRNSAWSIFLDLCNFDLDL